MKPNPEIKIDGNKPIKSTTIKIMLLSLTLTFIVCSILYFINRDQTTKEGKSISVTQKNDSGNNKSIAIENINGNADLSEKTENTTINNTYTSKSAPHTEEKNLKKSFSLIPKNSNLINKLIEQGLFYSNETVAFKIIIEPSTNIEKLQNSNRYYFSGGFVIIKINDNKLSFPNLKVPESFKYGNTNTYLQNFISHNLDSLIETNLVEISKEIKLNIK